jgi:hypothetical protein
VRRFPGCSSGGRSLSFRFSGGDSNDFTRPAPPPQMHPQQLPPTPKNPKRRGNQDPRTAKTPQPAKRDHCGAHHTQENAEQTPSRSAPSAPPRRRSATGQIPARNPTRERCRPEALAKTIAPNGRVDLLCVDQLRSLEPRFQQRSVWWVTSSPSRFRSWQLYFVNRPSWRREGLTDPSEVENVYQAVVGGPVERVASLLESRVLQDGGQGQRLSRPSPLDSWSSGPSRGWSRLSHLGRITRRGSTVRGHARGRTSS